MNNRHIRAVIFDFGNVLTLPQQERYVDAMRRLSGLDDERFRSAYRAGRHAYDRGTLDSEAFWRGVLEQGGRSPDELDRLDGALVREMTELDIKSWTVIRPEMVQWVRILKSAGLATGVLSNMPGDHAGYIERSFDWLELFDVLLFSYAVKLIKPEAAIYEECLRRFALPAEETLFIDDLAPNVEGARAVGMHAIEFHDTAGLVAALAEFPALPSFSR